MEYYVVASEEDGGGGEELDEQTDTEEGERDATYYM